MAKKKLVRSQCLTLFLCLSDQITVWKNEERTVAGKEGKSFKRAYCINYRVFEWKRTNQITHLQVYSILYFFLVFLYLYLISLLIAHIQTPGGLSSLEQPGTNTAMWQESFYFVNEFASEFMVLWLYNITLYVQIIM